MFLGKEMPFALVQTCKILQAVALLKEQRPRVNAVEIQQWNKMNVLCYLPLGAVYHEGMS